jgi:hypothetical protein
VLCLDCCEILEEKPYLRLVGWTMAFAIIVHFALGKFGYPGRGLIQESFMTETILLVICALIWKAVQKWKTPQRRILYELASLYSDRWGRVMILGIAIFAVVVLSGMVTFDGARSKDSQALGWFRAARHYAILGFGFIYLLLVFWRQGLAFFDFRIKNSLIHQELKNRETEDKTPEMDGAR